MRTGVLPLLVKRTVGPFKTTNYFCTHDNYEILPEYAIKNLSRNAVAIRTKAYIKLKGLYAPNLFLFFNPYSVAIYNMIS